MESELKAFDALLDKTVRAPRLSGSKVTELKEQAMKLVAHDHHLVTSILKLNTSLPAASTSRISLLYVFDAIARAARSAVLKGVGATASSERGKGTQAGLLSKMEGVVDSVVDGMIDDGKGGVWSEGKDKTRKIVEIWRKGGTFPEECVKRLAERIASASTPAVGSPAVRSPAPGSSKPGRSTTPVEPPPPHVIERYGVAAAAALASAAAAGSPPSRGSPAPAQPAGQLPPEIMAMLGVNSGAGPSTSTGAGTEHNTKTSSALDALLANVRKPNPTASAPNLDSAQLAALANITSFNAPPPPPISLPQPPRLNGTNGDSYDGYRQRSRSPPGWRDPRDRGEYRRDPRDRDRGDPRDRGDARRDPRDRDRDPRGDPRDREREYRPDPRRRDSRDRPDSRDRDPRRPPRHERSISPRRHREAGLPPKPTPPTVHAPLPRSPQRREYAEPGEVRGAPIATSMAAPASGMGGMPSMGGMAGAMPGGMPGMGAGGAAGMAASGAAMGGASAGGLDKFDMTSFDPTSPQSWAALGAAWKSSTGREPSQFELMQFLAGGMMMPMMGGMMGMGMGMMNGEQGGA